MTTSYGEPITLIKIYQVSSILHAGSIAIHRTLSRHYSVSSTSNNACPIAAMTNGTDLDMSSDTNTQEQEIFNTAIMTYATEDQTGRKSAPIHVPSLSNARNHVTLTVGSLPNPLRSRPLTHTWSAQLTMKIP